MNIKNKIFLYLFSLFIILNIMDVLTSINVLGGEGNPIFQMTGQIIWVIILKILLAVFIWKIFTNNRYKSVYYYHFFLSVMIYACLALLIAQIGNIYVLTHPEVLKASTQLKTAEKTSGYISFISFIYIIPMLINWIIFLLYEKSRPTITIRKKNEKTSWWTW